MINPSFKKIIGRLEYISFPEFNLSRIIAKVDTGAYTGALHVSEVEEVEIADKKHLRFKLLDDEHPEYQDIYFFSSHFKQKSVLSANGHKELRYFILITYIFAGETYTDYFNLSSRKEMRYPVLLGRTKLKDYLIDSEHTFLLDNSQNYEK